ncbi:MAG TPA: hypothetical protein VK361_06220 [Rubrobacteraceae bacterium]|nr:hypothetical protein [Rubrobacteraceae bacterium]
MDQARRREVLAAKVYASAHDLRTAEEALVELGELTQAEAGTLFKDEGFRERVKIIAWCLEHSNSPREFEEKVSVIVAAREKGEDPIPEGY